MELKGIPICSTISRTVLGVAIGTSLSWALVLQIPNHLTTLMLIPIYVIVIGALASHIFTKYFITTFRQHFTPLCLAGSKTW